MKKRTNLFFILLCLTSGHVVAQRFQISGGLVNGSYAMAEVSAFQDEVLSQLPVQAKVMSDFPNYIGYEGKVYYRIKRFSAGLYSSFRSTGSRASYADYSGSYEYNQQ